MLFNCLDIIHPGQLDVKHNLHFAPNRVTIVWNPMK